MIKALSLSILALPMLGLSTLAKADNYGCEAVLCFAGGKNINECQPTIKRVMRDLAKGKGFPHCTFVDAKGGQSQIVEQTGRYTNTIGKDSNVCPDGTVTEWWRKKKGWACNEVRVTFKGINDGADVTKIINW